MPFIALGMSRIALKISASVAAGVLGSAARRARSSAGSLSSGTRVIDHKIVPNDSTAPIQNETSVKVGMPPPCVASRLSPNQVTSSVGLR